MLGTTIQEAIGDCAATSWSEGFSLCLGEAKAKAFTPTLTVATSE